MNEILDDPLEYKLHAQKEKAKNIYLFSLIILLIIFIISVLIAWINIESIIFSGPINSILGFIIIYLSIKAERKSGIWLGTYPSLVSVLSFFIIYYNSYSPREAQIPIGILISFAGGCFTLISILEMMNLKKQRN